MKASHSSHDRDRLHNQNPEATVKLSTLPKTQGRTDKFLPTKSVINEMAVLGYLSVNTTPYTDLLKSNKILLDIRMRSEASRRDTWRVQKSLVYDLRLPVAVSERV